MRLQPADSISDGTLATHAFCHGFFERIEVLESNGACAHGRQVNRSALFNRIKGRAADM